MQADAPHVELDAFFPGRDGRFLWCCGGYRRWELVARRGQSFWQLASDWGQATIAGLVTPGRGFALTVVLDLSELPAGTLAVALCSRLRPGKLGLDGLPFYSTPEARLVVSQQRVTLHASGCPEASVEGPTALSKGPVTVRWEVSNEGLGSLFLDGAPFLSGLKHPDVPCFPLLSGKTAAEDPRGRFGAVRLVASPSAEAGSGCV